MYTEVEAYCVYVLYLLHGETAGKRGDEDAEGDHREKHPAS